jgi:hypothetical protein
MNNQTNQTGSAAGGDIVGRDKTTIHQYAPPRAPTIIEQLMQKLSHEMKTNQEIRHTIESLQFYYLRKSADGIDGLEAKLKAGDRHDEMLFAYERKEQFAKLLNKWSLYESAQEIFAYLLAKADHRFASAVQPKIKTCDQHEINQLVTQTIIEPLIEECGVGAFHLNHSIAMGMIYWLAEQCFVRWH